MTTTPTSGAAIQPVLWVSPEQFANFMDADEAQFGRYVPARKTSAGNFTMPLFAAPAQPAAQQGAAYAALPTSSHAGSFLIGTCPLYTADQLRAFADATHTLRAARGQAPAQTADSQLLQFYGVTTDAELIAAQAAHIEKLQAKLTKTPSFAPQRVREG